MTVSEIVAAVTRHSAGHTVVTGGEPMIAPEVVDLCRLLREARQHITVETAGTVCAPVVCDLMSISPKLRNSTPVSRDGGRWAAQHDRLRIQPDVLRSLMENYPYQLKFVVERPEDMIEIVALVRELEAGKDRVLLMPEGTDAETLREKGVWLAEICKESGFRYCPRLHVELWGNKRGV